jgi:hypothetical protein
MGKARATGAVAEHPIEERAPFDTGHLGVAAVMLRGIGLLAGADQTL